ncbi:MAG: TetR/AcrR family transcriptional regulator [Pseudomonadota bacterium]
MRSDHSKPGGDLREACLDEALKIIESDGVESLSMREVSRRLGVSHQAPYKHFESRDHILAEVVARAYDRFGEHLSARASGAAEGAELMEMGLAYFEYAQRHPLQYRLMFSTPLPDGNAHPRMMTSADRCYALLKTYLGQVPYVDGDTASGELVELDALFIWTLIHGLCTAMQSDAIDTMQISQHTLRDAIPHVLTRVDDALSVGAPDAANLAIKKAAFRRSSPPA